MTKPKRTRKKKGSTEYDPTLREAINIILEPHELTLDVRLSTLKENQVILKTIIGVLSMGLNEPHGEEYWSRFVTD